MESSPSQFFVGVLTTPLTLTRNSCHPERIKCKSSHRSCSVKKAVLKICAMFTGKPLMLEPLFFNKVAGFPACNFIQKRLQHSCFLVNIAKVLRTTILKASANGCFCKWFHPSYHNPLVNISSQLKYFVFKGKISPLFISLFCGSKIIQKYHC